MKVVMCFAALAFLCVFYGLAVYNTPKTDATVRATDFVAGRIIDDEIFYDANTMSVEEIQAFLDAKLPTCDMWGTGSSAGRIVNETGYVMPAGSTNADYARLRAAAGNSRYHEPPYVCVNKYYENPETHETLYETNGIVKDGMISAAQIIYNEAQRYSINPQVLLVLLKKESYVWGDTWPLKWEYNSVMGYGCPDTAPCDTAYYGFYNQVHMAAYQFDRYKQKNYEYNYHPGMVNNIYYAPNYSCGTKQVYIENMATASLYIYTPYTPNDAALQNYPGTSYCGSYGNRNFFMYFSEWFGNAYASTSFKAINEYYYGIGGEDSYLGKSIGTIKENKQTGISWQEYENGFILGSEKTGYYESMGGIRDKWAQLGFENGKLGFPIGSIYTNPTTGISWQEYENGFILGSEKNGYYESSGKIRDTWGTLGYESGKLGFPAGDIMENPTTGISWQEYENGFILGSEKTGYYESMGGIRDKWAQFGFENGKLGFPIGGIEKNDNIYTQLYQYGIIIGNDELGFRESSSSFYNVWMSLRDSGRSLGIPNGDVAYNEITGISWQSYEKGFILGSENTGFFESSGEIRKTWEKLGFETGTLGFPIGEIHSNKETGIYWQEYQNGFILGSSKTGYYESSGQIRLTWEKTGFEGGRLGFPIGDIVMSSDGAFFQQYQNGTIYCISSRCSIR